MSAKIHSITTKSLAPSKKLQADYPNLCPQFPASITTFLIDNVNAPISNALRRVIANEMVVKCLDCELSDIDTDNEFIIHEMIQLRLRMLPLQQSCKVGAKFTLDVTNKSLELIDVKSKDLKGPFVAFNQNITLFTLAANKYCKITCKVVEAVGYMVGYGGAVMGVNTASIPQSMEDCEQSSSSTNVTKWMVKFTNNGTTQPQIIIKEAIQNIINRLRGITYDFITEDNTSVLLINNETETIGSMLLKQIIDLNPTIEYVTVNQVNRVVKLRIIIANPERTLKIAVDSLITIYSNML